MQDKFHHVELFLKLASEISDSRKQRIATMGFQSFLEMSSVSNVDCIYFWLTNHFNTSSCSIEMPNGFKFPISSSTIHNFFGIPIGGLPVVTKPTESTYDFIKQELGTTTPTIDYLFSIINDDLPEDKFCRIFILIVLSLFVAPNSSGVISKFVYNAIVDISRIAQYDWCFLALSYMVYSIKKARIKNRSSKKFLPGGSKLLLVISYFEFLIITEFKLPNNEPRLPIWSANMLNSYMALDALHGKNNEYGRLPRKHISSTPFNDPDFFELPEEISDYIDSKFTDIKLFVKTQSPKASPPIDVSALLHQYMSESRSTYGRVEETKFCLPLFRFLLPGECLEDFSTDELDKGCLLQGNSKAEPVNNRQYKAADAPSFDGISNSIHILENDPLNYDSIPSEAGTPFACGSSSQFSLQINNHKAHSNSHVNPNVPSTENPIRILDFISPKGYQKNIGTPIEDPMLVQEKLMNPVLNHSDPRNKQILHESTVGFSLLNASLVKMPLFKEKQWILIVANFRANFFDIMNPYYNGDTFLPTISAVIYNFKTLFSATYGNSTSFNIGNFESRFVASPKVIFRYDSGIFLLQFISKYKGVGLECLSTYDIQALREKFLFEIVTCNDNEIQLPLVSSFLQSHVSPLLTLFHPFITKLKSTFCYKLIFVTFVYFYRVSVYSSEAFNANQFSFCILGCQCC